MQAGFSSFARVSVAQPCTDQHNIYRITMALASKCSTIPSAGLRQHRALAPRPAVSVRRASLVAKVANVDEAAFEKEVLQVRALQAGQQGRARAS